MFLITILSLIRLPNFGAFFAFNRNLLNLLFEAVNETLLGWCEEQGFLPGICSVMHTFGAKLAFDPHIHILITEGGLKMGFGWTSCSHFPHQVLKSRFRTLLIKKLRNAAKQNILSVPSELKAIWRKNLISSAISSLLLKNFIRLSGLFISGKNYKTHISLFATLDAMPRDLLFLKPALPAILLKSRSLNCNIATNTQGRTKLRSSQLKDLFPD